MEAIDPKAVELACNANGCALIPNDGNPLNDITPKQAKNLQVVHKNGNSAGVWKKYYEALRLVELATSWANIST